jgi:two-component system OmpR family response regulator
VFSLRIVSATDRTRVLVVDDEASVREVLGDYFEGLGYDVVFADNAIGALNMARDHNPHVVLLDLNMPGAVQGDAVIESISRRAPVIVITASVDFEVARRTLREGAMDFISKPFDFDRLRTIVEAAIAMGGR